MRQRNEKNEHPFVIIVNPGMDLNHIELPAFTVAQLYPDQLVDTASAHLPAPLSSPAPEMTPSRYLGGHAKKVLVVVRYPDDLFLPDESLRLLTNILQACQLGLGDVAILNRHHQNGPFSEWLQELRPRIVLQFGVSPAELDLAADFPAYQLQPLAGVTHLFASGLEKIGSDKSEKMKLWDCLKRLFNR